MLILTDKAEFKCPHNGSSGANSSQHFVRINGGLVLVGNDPAGNAIDAKCTNFNPTAGIKPCKLTVNVSKGKSTFIRIGDKPVCLSSVDGITDGTPPATHLYTVHRSGQGWVRGAA